MLRAVYVSSDEVARDMLSCLAEYTSRRKNPLQPLRRTFDDYCEILFLMCEAWFEDVDLPTAFERSRLPSAPRCFRALHALAEAAHALQAEPVEAARRMNPARDVAPPGLIYQVLLEALQHRRNLCPLPLRSTAEYQTVTLTLLEKERPGVPVDEALERALDGTDAPFWFESVNELGEMAHAIESGAIRIH